MRMALVAVFVLVAAALFASHLLLAPTQTQADPPANTPPGLAVQYTDAKGQTKLLTYPPGQSGTTTLALLPDQPLGPVIGPPSGEETPIIIQLQEQPVGPFRRRFPVPFPPTAASQVQAQVALLAQERAMLVQAGATQNIPLTVSRDYRVTFNGLAALVPTESLDKVAKLPGVRRVFRDMPVQADATLAESTAQIGAPTVWTLTDASGNPVTGIGQRIAIVDTGIDYTHPDLGGCLGPLCKVRGGYDFVNNDANPKDDHGHGTHVAGIAAAKGSVKGVAPDANLWAFKVLNQFGGGSFSQVIAGIERAADLDGNPNTVDPADVINLSLGGSGSPDDPVSQAVDNATAIGAVVVVAAGNSGWYQRISSPGVAATAVTVGAVDSADTLAKFSSRGPVGDTWAIKPDIVAPGVAITSTWLGGGYNTLSGTSMATPHVAGGAALLRQLRPTWTPQEIKGRLTSTAVNLGLDPFSQGAGLLWLPQAAGGSVTPLDNTASFGLVNLAQNPWTVQRDVTLRNKGTAFQTANFLGLDPGPGSFSPPSGTATLTTIPGSVGLAAGATGTFQVTLEVNTATIPLLGYAPNAYYGVFRIDLGGETLRIPFAYLVASQLILDFSPEPFIVIVHDGNSVPFSQFFPGAHRTVLLNPGNYDVMVGFLNGPPNTFLVRQDIGVATTTALSIAQAEAVNRVDLSLKNEHGDPLTPWSGMLGFIHKASGIGWMTGGGIGQSFFFGNLPSTYAFDVLEAAYGGSTASTVYDIPFSLRDGITASNNLANDPAQLNVKTYKYALPPTTEAAFIWHWSCYQTWFCVAAYQPSGTQNVLAQPLEAKHFMGVKPSPAYPETSREWVFQHTAGTTFTFDTSKLFADTPFYQAATHQELLAFVAGDTVQPSGSIKGATVPVNFPPPHWAFRLQNDANSVYATQNQGWWTWGYGPFLFPTGGSQPNAAAPQFALLQEGSVLNNGSLLPGQTYNLPSPGPYTFRVFQSELAIGGFQAQATAELTFDTSKSDKNPPYIWSLEVLREVFGGEMEFTETIHTQSVDTVFLTLKDDVALNSASVALSVRSHSGGSWQQLPLTPSATTPGLFSATMPPLPNNTYWDLMVVAQDTSGNEVSYTIEPGLFVNILGGPPIPGITGPGLAVLALLLAAAAWWRMPRNRARRPEA